MSKHLKWFGAGYSVHSVYDLGAVASGIGVGDDSGTDDGRGTCANRLPGLSKDKYGTASNNATSADT